jgi:hypothetical protein
MTRGQSSIGIQLSGSSQIEDTHLQKERGWTQRIEEGGLGLSSPPFLSTTIGPWAEL